jgi:hypothetical protein
MAEVRGPDLDASGSAAKDAELVAADAAADDPYVGSPFDPDRDPGCQIGV